MQLLSHLPAPSSMLSALCSLLSVSCFIRVKSWHPRAEAYRNLGLTRPRLDRPTDRPTDRPPSNPSPSPSSMPFHVLVRSLSPTKDPPECYAESNQDRSSEPSWPEEVTSSQGTTMADSTDPPDTVVHLPRFEFSDYGTKVVMVESPTLGPAAWHVTWPGKSPAAAIPARDADCRRLYSLLSPEATAPAAVTIDSLGRLSLTVKPLPAIFPTCFDAEMGSRDVLHTLWAKERLSKLQREMDTELSTNAESVGLEMALAEK
ncbi:hypothetical protein XA68_13793 [Ophiocordyceps unilateralis]|uniref:SHSP domain-containing protein n=1 Tax=Ophiocordyceps unilateralis TaxID=268505 RepID=A0A2A9PVC4_OPHUN|nr:hypothetical protein XA68_13793 [Ophiocordyceps unilateralis]